MEQAHLSFGPPQPGAAIRLTSAVCPECHEALPAALMAREDGAWLERTCPTHGPVRHRIAGDAAYWGELDRYFHAVNDRAWPQRDFMVRMTEKCNLDCPICLAKANTQPTPDLDLDAVRDLLRQHPGAKIDLLAAEPTMRDDLPDWIRTVKRLGGIASLHTNGLKLANPRYCKEIVDAGVDEVFLQFDGLDDDANVKIRGRKLNRARLAALDNLRALNVATSLIVVIARGVNEPQVQNAFRFALRPENRFIREVFFLGMRMLGSAAEAGLGEQALMPDDLIGLLCEQEPRFTRTDLLRFNKLYFAMLSALQVRKCVYVQHSMVVRDPDAPDGYSTAADVLDLEALAAAADAYARRRLSHPRAARFGLAAALAREGARPRARKMVGDLLRLENLLAHGMNLRKLPDRFLLVGFITACDPWNFDAVVAQNCGKGELSADGGFDASGAVANLRREERFARAAAGYGPGEGGCG